MLSLRQVSKVDPSMPQEDAKAHLMSRIDTYIQVCPTARASLKRPFTHLHSLCALIK